MSACEVSPEQAEVKLVESLPGFSELADSLSNASIKVAKWANNNGSLVYSKPQTVDWKKELESLRKINVNHQRYRGSYTVQDSTIGQERIVRFRANEPDQEVKKMEIHLNKGRIVYYAVEKSRKSIFSSSHLWFEFTPTTYRLSFDQKINFVFSNHQEIYATLIHNGDLWRASLNLNDHETPIQFIIDDSYMGLTVINGEERIGFNQTTQHEDTTIFASDHFDSEFKLVFSSDSTLEGVWISRKTEEIKVITLKASKGVPYRFEVDDLPNFNLQGDHKMVFYDYDGNPQPPVLLRLNQAQHIVTGTILTKTGDYRYLDGAIRNDSLFLSTLDGTHSYLFTASIGDGVLDGHYYFGGEKGKRWTATLNDAVDLPDPNSLTHNTKDQAIDFSFINSQKEMVGLQEFKGQPTLISVMGTWCSNCMDEAVFLKEAHELYAPKGLEIIALDFELVADSARALQNIKRHVSSMELPYPVLLAGVKSTKRMAQETLPWLDEVISYPTLITLDRNHNVVSIHTGFSGPATGRETYNAFRKEYFALLDSLTQE
ncbi:MAG: hypothetical protein Salg2KO_02230 [Salibacteraceae bacterium]